MSWILGIDTSSTDLGIGLYRDGQPSPPIPRFIQNSHAEHITAVGVNGPQSNNGRRPAGITHIAIAAGPGHLPDSG